MHAMLIYTYTDRRIHKYTQTDTDMCVCVCMFVKCVLQLRGNNYKVSPYQFTIQAMLIHMYTGRQVDTQTDRQIYTQTHTCTYTLTHTVEQSLSPVYDARHAHRCGHVLGVEHFRHDQPGDRAQPNLCGVNTRHRGK